MVNTKMRVLHILDELKFSGAEIMYVAAAKLFQDLGCELYVVNTADHLGEYTPFFKDAGYTILHWPYEHLSLVQKFIYWNRTIRFIRRNKIDVVHVHRPDMKCPMAYCAWRAGVRSVYTYHSEFPSRVITYPYHVLLRYACQYLFHQVQQTISDSVYDHERHYFHNHTIQINNWYNTDKYYPARAGEKARFRQMLDIPEHSLVIISIGGCSYIKRHEDILQAVAIARQTCPQILYLHLGEGDKTAEEQQLAASLGIHDVVRFLGNQKDVRPYLVAADIYVMSSRNEGMPITAIEAMACGVPAVFYNVPGLWDFNKHGDCSLLVEEQPEKLAEAILQLSQDPARQQRLTQQASDYIHREFDMEKNVKKIFEVCYSTR